MPPPIVTGYTGLTQVARLCLENLAGEQLLLAQTVGASTMSLTSQPNAVGALTTGMHLHVYIIGNAGAGTIGITGTAPGTGSAVVSQTYHVNPAPLNAMGYSEFTTTEVYATVNASAIVLSAGLTAGCFIMVYGSPAGKFLVPSIADAEEKIAKFAPPDKRGILWKNIRVIALTKTVSVDKFDTTFTPDSLWAFYMLIHNNPTVGTAPTTPTVLLAALTKAATMTLTTGPTAPGMFFVFTPAANSIAGTIVLTGKDIYGNTQTETIVVGANNAPVMSTKRYSSLTAPGANQFTTTGLSAAATLAVTGVFAWVYTWTWDGISNLVKSSASLELFDGVMGCKLPYTIFSDGTFDWQKQKEILFTAKGEAQDFLILGDPNPTIYPSGTNPFALLAQPSALPMPSWPGTFFIDGLPSGVPLVTQEGTLNTFKANLLTGLKSFYVGDGMQRWSSTTYETEPDFAIDATMIFQNYSYYNNYFKPNAKFGMGAIFQGSLLGNSGGVNYFENVTWTFPAKVDTFKVERSKSPVEAALKVMAEYDFSLGYAFRVSMTSQIPPTYAV